MPKLAIVEHLRLRVWRGMAYLLSDALRAQSVVLADFV